MKKSEMICLCLKIGFPMTVQHIMKKDHVNEDIAEARLNKAIDDFLEEVQ